MVYNLEISEDSLDAHLPSYPTSPRSLSFRSESTVPSNEKHDEALISAVEFLHRDNEFLVAAETGNDRMLEIFLSSGTDIQAKDHLGRNALHLAVCADSYRAIVMLIEAGVATNVKDNLGMTALSLSLMRRPSLNVAKLLFKYGAKIIPRSSPMDTGLFIQFVMMSIPTSEDADIMQLLVEKGAVVNDPEAPGGRQGLHFAAMSNNCDLIRILVVLGADLYMLNHKRKTPRELAIIFKCREAELLLKELEDADLNSLFSATSLANRRSSPYLNNNVSV